MFGLAISFKEAVEVVKPNSHIEVIEQLTQKAVTWTPSCEVHVAVLGPEELRTAYICAYVTLLPRFQSQENTQASPAGLRACRSTHHAPHSKGALAQPKVYHKRSCLSLSLVPLPVPIGSSSENLSVNNVSP